MAVAATAYQLCSVRKAWLGASLTAAYLAIEEQQDLSATARTALAVQAARNGERMARTPGYHKELSDTCRILATLELALGNREQAMASARSSLRLHPYSPNTLWLMAKLLRDHPAEAAQWRHAADYVMNETTTGFTEPYPVAPD